MSFMKPYGTAFVGYVQLTNAAPGPVAVSIRTAPGGSPYTLAANERMYVTSIAMSSNDAANPLVQLDIGAGTYVVVSAYLGATLPPYVDNTTAPPIIGKPGVAFRATTSAVTAAKTVEVKLLGYISAT